jgi:hypothetical protein
MIVSQEVSPSHSDMDEFHNEPKIFNRISVIDFKSSIRINTSPDKISPTFKKSLSQTKIIFPIEL